jgi:hypothetical protein
MIGYHYIGSARKSNEQALAAEVYSDLTPTSVTVIVSVLIVIFIIVAYLLYYCTYLWCCNIRGVIGADATEGRSSSTISMADQNQHLKNDRPAAEIQAPDDLGWTGVNKLLVDEPPYKSPYKSPPNSGIEQATRSPPPAAKLPAPIGLVPLQDMMSDSSSNFSEVSKKSSPSKRVQKSSLITTDVKLSNAFSVTNQKSPRSEFKLTTRSPPRKKRRRSEKRLKSPGQGRLQQQGVGVTNLHDQKAKQPARSEAPSIVNFDAPITAEIIRQHTKEPRVREYRMFKSPSLFD